MSRILKVVLIGCGLAVGLIGTANAQYAIPYGWGTTATVTQRPMEEHRSVATGTSRQENGARVQRHHKLDRTR
jgi:hypothetical protein